MTCDYLKNNWSVLAKKTKRQPLFMNGAPRIKSSYEWTALVPSLWSYIGSLLFCAIGALLLSLAIFNSGRVVSKLALPVLYPVGTFLFVGGFLGWVKLKYTTIFWGSRTSEIVVSCGWPFWPKIIVLNRSEVKVRLSISPEQSGWFISFMKGWTVLSLCKSDHEEIAVNIASCSNRESLISAFNKLEEFLGTNASDDTLVEITSPNGERLTVSRTPISKSSATFKTMELIVKPDLGLAVFRPTGYMQLFSFIFLCAGIGAWCGMPTAFRDTSSIWPLLLIGGVGTVFTVFGASGLFIGFGVQRVVVNRKRGIIFIKQGLLSAHRGNLLCRLDDIAAIQVCSRYVSGSDDGYMTFELNIVLYGSPQAKRVNVLSYSDQNKVLTDGQIFADFISKPLLNHCS